MNVIEIEGLYFIQATEIEEGKYYRFDCSPKSVIVRAVNHNNLYSEFRLPDGEIVWYDKNEIEQRLGQGSIFVKASALQVIQLDILSCLPEDIPQETKDAVETIAQIWEEDSNLARKLEQGLIALAKSLSK